MADQTERKTPPYVPFTTFVNFLDSLKEAMPPQIDKTVLRNYSGSTQSHLMVALRYFELIAPDGTVTERLRMLVKARGSEDWKETWSDVLFDSYADTTQKLDLDNATQGQLDNAFRESGLASQPTREKAVRFFLAAMDSAGIGYSRFFSARGARTASRPKKSNGGTRKAESRKADAVREDFVEEEVDPPGLMTHQFPLRRDLMVKLTLPLDLTQSDVERLHRFIQALPIDESAD